MKKAEIEIQNLPIPEGIVDLQAIQIWNATAMKKIKSVGRLTMLEKTLRLLQRVNAEEKKIEEDGLMVRGEHMDHCHPLLKVLQKDLVLLSKLWVNLGLGSEPFRIEKYEI